MQIGNRFRYYPTPAQEQMFLQWIGAQRYIQNAKVNEDRYFRRFARSALSLTGIRPPLDQKYAQFRTDQTAWMDEIPGVILRNGAVRFKQAYANFFSGKSGRPTIRGKTGEQSVWITGELLQFIPQVEAGTGEITTYRIVVGSKKFGFHDLAIVAHRAFQPAASIHIAVNAGKWFVSFSHEDDVPEPSDADTAAWLQQFGETELLNRTFGGDRGIAIPLAGNDGQAFDIDPVSKARIEKKQRAAKRWQRKLARRIKGSSNRRKAIRCIAQLRNYEGNVRSNFAHQTSHTLAEDPHYLLYVFEALGVQRMTRRPKAKQNENGRFLRNGARAKAGLATGILKSCWGKTKTYTQYKARRKGKLCIDVAPNHTSQECSDASCGHIHPDNRVTQDRFVCQRCGAELNADHNAAIVIARRGVRLLLSGGWSPKHKKSCTIRKQEPIGRDSAESPAGMLATPVETMVRRGRRKATPHVSAKQEMPCASREAPSSGVAL